jgi:hypothetical protein
MKRLEVERSGSIVAEFAAQAGIALVTAWNFFLDAKYAHPATWDF